jgi:hypothetical protein
MQAAGRSRGRGGLEIRTARSIPAPRERIFDFLCFLEHHWELIADRVVPLGVANGERSRTRLRGPLGLRRTLRTQLTFARSPDSMVGSVEAGRRTRGTVRWSIQRLDVGSWVEVTGHADTLGPFDRLLWVCGGRRWLARSLELALEALEERMRQPPPVDAPGSG